MEYTWKRGVSIVSAQVEIRGDNVQAIDNYSVRDFWYKKVLNKSLKAK